MKLKGVMNSYKLILNTLTARRPGSLTPSN